MRDENSKDSAYVRQMWSQYTRKAAHNEATSQGQIRRQPEQVHAYLKRMEEGPESEDAQTLTSWADGKLATDDQKMQNYFIKQYQRKRY